VKHLLRRGLLYPFNYAGIFGFVLFYSNCGFGFCQELYGKIVHIIDKGSVSLLKSGIAIIETL
ncbi:MAG: hypothetical protein IJB49_00620, partial [Clostridia bacterium]|nr:hypothetical protein [Clostridia bacterium]